MAALVFAVAFLATHFILNPSETGQAVQELNALIDTAEARAEAEKTGMQSLDADADESAIRKARTVERFLAHDDTLLETDALLTLCELIGLERIAVADGEGAVIAASDAALIGTDRAGDTDMAWGLGLLEDGAAPAAQPNGQAGRIAGVARSDIDGFILAWSRDALLADAAGAADLAGAAENLAVEPDALKLVETAGEDGVFEQDGMLYVQRAEGESMLIASRPLTRVHAVQRAVLTSLGIFAAASVLALFLWQIGSGRSAEPCARDEAEETSPEEGETLPEEGETPPPTGQESVKRPRKKRRMPLIEITEMPDGEEAEAFFDEPAPAPRSRKKRASRAAGSDSGKPDGDESFDKIFE